MWTLTRPHLVRALNCGYGKIDQLALLFSNLNKRDIYDFLQGLKLNSRIARKSNEIFPKYHDFSKKLIFFFIVRLRISDGHLVKQLRKGIFLHDLKAFVAFRCWISAD